MTRPQKLLLNPSALQRFSKELDDIAPLAYEGDDRDEKERATASMYQDKTMVYALDVERLLDDNGVGGGDEGGEGTTDDGEGAEGCAV